MERLMARYAEIELARLEAGLRENLKTIARSVTLPSPDECIWLLPALREAEIRCVQMNMIRHVVLVEDRWEKARKRDGDG